MQRSCRRIDVVDAHRHVLCSGATTRRDAYSELWLDSITVNTKQDFPACDNGVEFKCVECRS